MSVYPCKKKLAKDDQALPRKRHAPHEQLSFLISKNEEDADVEKSWRSDKNIRMPTDYEKNEEIQILQDELRYMRKRNQELKPGIDSRTKLKIRIQLEQFFQTCLTQVKKEIYSTKMDLKRQGRPTSDKIDMKIFKSSDPRLISNMLIRNEKVIDEL